MRGKKFLASLIFILLTFMQAASADAGRLSLIYTTDAHGRVVTNGETIGLDLIASIRAHHPDSILVDAGDFSHGLPIATISKAHDVVTLMKHAGYTAAAVGNHEFNYDPEALATIAAQAEAEPRPMILLSANAMLRDGAPLFTPGRVVWRDGVQIGLFGITTSEAAQHMGARAIPGLSFEDYAETSRRVAGDLRELGCDIVVAVTHIENEESRQLALEVDGIDVMVCGHSHAVVDETVNGTRLVSSGAHGKNVGVLEINVGDDGAVSYRNELLDREAASAYGPDPFVRILTDTVAHSLDEKLGVKVGRTDVFLDGEKESVRVKSTNLGNMIADAMIAATGADVAVTNGGGIRASIPAGDITLGHVVTVFPFDNTVITKRVTGHQLRDIVEAGLSKLPAPSGAFPQVGGFRVTADAGAAPGSRVLSMTLSDGRPVLDDEVYELATNDFLAGGGDGYPHLAEIEAGKMAGSLSEIFLSLVTDERALDYDAAQRTRIEY